MSSEVDLRADKVIIQKAGGFCELQIKNATAGIAGQVFTDTGDGTGEWAPGGGGAQTWDDTLTEGNTTSQNTEYIAPGTSYYLEYVTPTNYDSGDGVPGRFARWVGTFNGVNYPDPRPNVVASFWSYNYQPGGSPIAAGEAAFAFKSETYYNADGTHLMEFHLPEFVDDAGVGHRLFSIYVHRPDGASYVQTQNNTWSFRPSWSNAVSYMDLSTSIQAGNGNTELALTGMTTSGGTGDVTIKMVDRNASVGKLTYDGATMAINASNGSGDIFLQGGRTFLSSYVSFNQSDYFSDGNVYFLGVNNLSGKGYIFSRLDGTEYARITSAGITTLAAGGGYGGFGAIYNSKGIFFAYTAKTATYGMSADDHIVNCTANSFTVTLPTAVFAAGFSQQVQIWNTGAGTITAAAIGGQSITGSTSIAAGTFAVFASNNANWFRTN